MKVQTAFAFTDDQLRSIRAAFGRGGVATRKESRLFIARAVEAALRAAPEAKPKRRPVPKPAPVAPVVLTEDEEVARDRALRDKIRRLYRATRPALEGRA